MEVFVIAPGGMKPWWAFLAAGLVLVAVFTLLALSVMGSRWARFEISRDQLRIRGDFYGRRVPAAALRAAESRRVDLNASAEFRPRLRTWGTGLPGYQSGWFRLRNGEKALVYLTDRSKAIYVPTTEGYSLLLSPDDPDGFLQALKAAVR